MHPSSKFSMTRLVGLWIALAGACGPLVVKADDAAAAAPADTNVTIAATAPATTNLPTAVAVPEITNAPAPAITNTPVPVMETTNTPATAATPETTNVPAAALASAITNPPAVAPFTTNLPATAIAPAITNAPAATPAVTNQPATALAPGATNAPSTTNMSAAVTTPVATNAPATTSKPATAPLSKAAKRSLYQPFNLGVEAGTTGFGGVADWRFADHFGIEGGMDYLNYSMHQTISGIPYSAHLRMMSEHAGLNLYPWRDRSFHLSLGAYFNQNRLTGSAVSDGTLVIDGATVPNGDSVDLTYKQEPVDPYASIGGNFYFDKAKHFSLGAELGVFYLGNHPDVSVTTTPSGVVPQSALDSYQKKVEHDLKKFPVWPILKLSLNYSF